MALEAAEVAGGEAAIIISPGAIVHRNGKLSPLKNGQEYTKQEKGIIIVTPITGAADAVEEVIRVAREATLLPVQGILLL